jgi:hypothetical protein
VTKSKDTMNAPYVRGMLEYETNYAIYVENHNDQEEVPHLRDVFLNATGDGEGREIISTVYYESKDGEDISRVEINKDKGLDGTNGTISIGTSFCFFLLSYTYLTSP